MAFCGAHLRAVIHVLEIVGGFKGFFVAIFLCFGSEGFH